VTLTERDNLILAAAIEFGPDYFYDIRNGTLGITLYVEVSNKEKAHRARLAIPLSWKGLYVIVIYRNTPDFADSILYDPESS
jgi:hypothetical protein